MRSKRFLTILGGAALCLTAAGCSPDANTNTNANANRAANANATATPTPTATPASTSNANSVNYNMTREEYNKTANSYLGQVKNAGQAIGAGAEDGWIHLKVRGALAAVDDLRDSTINVDVDNNVVTLRGSVANAAQKTKAGDEAKKIEGVKSVTNRLEVRADGSSNGNTNTNTGNANKK